MFRLLILSFLLLMPIGIVYADCSTLALGFSQNPKTLDTNELSALEKCVSDKLRQRLFGGGPSIPGGSSRAVPASPAPMAPMAPMPPRRITVPAERFGEIQRLEERPGRGITGVITR